jgi:hypothetical protein
MLFKPEMIDAIVAGRKTQTRRLVLSSHRVSGYRYSLQGEQILSVSDNKLKWELGRTYAVQSGRGKPGVWVNARIKGICYAKPDWTEELGNWEPLRIRITAIRREHVQDISNADAEREGYPVSTRGVIEGLVADMPRTWYQQLWGRINRRNKRRWQDNPEVWVLEFEVAR